MINRLIYMDDIKLFTKNEKQVETVIQAIRIYNQDIGIEFDIEKCAMLIMRSRNRTANSRKNQNAQGKGNLQVLGNIASEYHQTSGNERKILQKSISDERENFSKPSTAVGISLKGCPSPCKTFGTITELDKRRYSSKSIKAQQNSNNWEIEMERKTTVWIPQATN